jgi:hypothetical protein
LVVREGRRDSVGVSIYYTATRPQPLTHTEQTAIDAVVARYPVEELLEECGIAEDEYNGEAFCIYPTDDDTEPGVVFEGATKLPLCTVEAFGAAIEYWCQLLSEVRRVVPRATWRVHVDDHDIAWSEKLREFDPHLS